ncbi:hypothetical protein TTHERM_00313350 (macronuclear) [Tetrahymena thermophila SB210]|uniref:Transmembrane protein n=1 Tax=Tetrahymena thermophila (strain SB210) TaxID=312017 RepID=Q22KE6_TETTS|nr:hypothetical protein TTHERM_00313350 [Tetrahymena thermophila SB210]EAR85853.1 hypothetical protein TTHERM_00313350 [Tetrahymena thermophila SB210]|eukprot:XP_001033516.1 hypothetical protein TTHERM_00313350 [Tetrahymena thermophila SB210]
MKIISLFFVCLIAVIQINAKNNCLEYVLKQRDSGKYCELQNDNECWNEMKSYQQCEQQCFKKSKNEPYESLQCVKETCNPSNPQVQWFKTEELICVDIFEPHDFNGLDKCQLDLFNRAAQGQFCQQGNTDCIQAIKSAKQCSITCFLKKNIREVSNQCLKEQCSSVNPQAQSFLNSLSKCGTIDISISSSNTLAFTSFLLAFLII